MNAEHSFDVGNLIPRKAVDDKIKLQRGFGLECFQKETERHKDINPACLPL